MTFDPTKPVQTRDGRKARILCTDMNHPTYPIAAAITEHDGAETVTTYTRGGRFIKEGEGELDLVNIEPSKFIHVTARDFDLYGNSDLDAVRSCAPNDAVMILERSSDGKITVHEVAE